MSETAATPPPRPSTSTEPFSDAWWRHRITDAMAAACFERGYRETTVADICDEGTLSRTSVYQRFANKEEVLDALIERVSGEVLTRVEEACEGTDGIHASVEAGLGAGLEWIAADPAAARALLLEAPAGSPIARAAREATAERFAELLGDLVGENPGRPPIMEEMIVGGVLSSVTQLVHAGEYERVPSLRSALVDFVLQPYRPRD